MLKIWKFLIMLICATLFCGCTVHFKAKDVELDSVANHTYFLESVDIAKAEPALTKVPVLP